VGINIFVGNQQKCLIFELFDLITQNLFFFDKTSYLQKENHGLSS